MVVELLVGGFRLFPGIGDEGDVQLANVIEAIVVRTAEGHRHDFAVLIPNRSQRIPKNGRASLLESPVESPCGIVQPAVLHIENGDVPANPSHLCQVIVLKM